MCWDATPRPIVYEGHPPKGLASYFGEIWFLSSNKCQKYQLNRSFCISFQVANHGRSNGRPRSRSSSLHQRCWQRWWGRGPLFQPPGGVVFLCCWCGRSRWHGWPSFCCWNFCTLHMILSAYHAMFVCIGATSMSQTRRFFALRFAVHGSKTWPLKTGDDVRCRRPSSCHRHFSSCVARLQAVLKSQRVAFLRVN